jgi:hypothetical protein
MEVAYTVANDNVNYTEGLGRSLYRVFFLCQVGLSSLRCRRFYEGTQELDSLSKSQTRLKLKTQTQGADQIIHVTVQRRSVSVISQLTDYSDTD